MAKHRMTPSDEQKSIISAISTAPPDAVIRVSAVAGSGKTSTALFIAEAYPDRAILLLTYNRHLSDENAEKADVRGLYNITMRTFHSFAGEYFGRTVYDDKILIDCIKGAKKSRSSTPKATSSTSSAKGLDDYDIIILDEFQDTTEPLFDFDLLLMQSYPSARFIILGDPRQCIYQYNGATSQYMTLFSEITGRRVHDERLSTTYRVPSGIATFVNEVFVKAPHHIDMIPFREGEKPIYKSAFSMDAGVRYAVRYVHDAIASGRYQPKDIFILAASAKMKTMSGGGSMAAQIGNQLSYKGHLVYLDVEGGSADSECTDNKIVVSSIHKSKGRERRLVVFIGLDSGYLKFYKKDYTSYASSITPSGKVIAPNEIYVACTRASEMLVMIATNSPAQFIRRRRVLSRSITDAEDLNMHFSNDPSVEGETYSSTNVTDLISSMPATIKSAIIDDALDIDEEYEDDELGCKMPKFDNTKLPSKTKQKKGDVDYVEQVSDINGVATTLEAARQEWMKSEVKKAFAHETGGHGLTKTDLLGTAIAIQSTLRHHLYRRTQLNADEWVSHEKIFSLGARIRARLPVDRAEVSMTLLDWRCNVDGMPVSKVDSLAARFDIMFGDDIYEVKTTTKISHDHIIQAAIYRWMIDVATRRVSDEEILALGSRPVSRQVYSPSSYIRRDSRLWNEMIPSYDPGEMPRCDLIEDDDVVSDRVENRREVRMRAKKRLDGRFVRFRTSAKGRKDYYGAYYDADTVIDMNGDEKTCYNPKTLSAPVPKPNKRTLVYNCLSDKMVEVRIRNMALFEKLIKMKAAIDDDDIFVKKNKTQAIIGDEYYAKIYGEDGLVTEVIDESEVEESNVHYDTPYEGNREEEDDEEIPISFSQYISVPHRLPPC